MSTKNLGTAAAAPTDVVTKSYVDTLAAPSWKQACTFATAAVLPFGAAVYAVVSAGVGDTLTAASNGILTVDGQAVWGPVSQTVTACTFVTTTITVTVASTAAIGVGQPVTISGITGFTTNNPNGNYTVASVPSSTTFTNVANVAPTGTYGSGGTVMGAACRILVKNEATAANNGIYTVTTIGTASAKYVLTRAPDMDSAATTGTSIQKYDGCVTFIEGGTANAGTVWALNSSTIGGVTPGTTSLTFVQPDATYMATAAGNGLQNTSGVLSVKPLTSGGITVASGGVSVAAGNGIAVGSTVTVTADTGISVSGTGVAVAADYRSNAIPFYISSTLTTGVKLPEFIAPVAMTVVKMLGRCASGASATYRGSKNGGASTTATSASTGTTVVTTTVSVALAAGDRFALEVVAAGTGADLSVTFWATVT